ncbi:MAG: hypothetical protein IKH69_01825 [Bacteroidaceae bacterium]|nr:hypothetical protein [Bacteroidaceae bacterium]MBR3716747.1 hypothetical protein [Bacteroidaceae bacterium]
MTQEELQKALEAISKGGIHVAGDLVLEKHVEHEVANVEAGGIGIQNIYSSAKPKASKPKSHLETKASTKPMTLKYYKHGNNGVLMQQRSRVDILFRKWNEWGWIDDKTLPDDFDAFFEGEPRHCNITWTANTTILTILLQELLKQPYIEKQTGCSANSLVEQQFGKTPNSDRSRIDSCAEEKIKLTCLILDARNPLPDRRGTYSDEDYDTSDAAMQEIYAGQLRSTKGI